MGPIDAWLAETEAHRSATGRPVVTLTYAQSLDGCITARRGEPLALSGEASQTFTHRLRARHDAILVGIGTVLADNPRLTVRLVEGKNPQAVVLDSHLRTPADANLLQRGGAATWIATTPSADRDRQAALQAAGARLLFTGENTPGYIHIPSLLSQLAKLGVNSLMVEGGANVITHFLTHRLVDRIIVTIAPVFVGGLHAVEGQLSNGKAGTSSLLPRLVEWESVRMGEDLVLWGIPSWL